MRKSTESLKKEWENREELFGNTKRAVLFKRFPTWLNNRIHRKHIKFIKENLPIHISNILDVGCGYGRISQEIKKSYQDTEFSGIELCTEFANNYEKTIGKCFNGSVQDFKTEKSYDVIIVVTLLMYLEQSEQKKVIEDMYSYLAPGGVIICLEPAIEFINLWRLVTRKKNASPTGGSVTYFTKKELKDVLTYPIKNDVSIKLLPCFKSTTLHHGFTIHKPK